MNNIIIILGILLLLLLIKQCRKPLIEGQSGCIVKQTRCPNLSGWDSFATQKKECEDVGCDAKETGFFSRNKCECKLNANCKGVMMREDGPCSKSCGNGTKTTKKYKIIKKAEGKEWCCGKKCPHENGATSGASPCRLRTCELNTPADKCGTPADCPKNASCVSEQCRCNSNYTQDGSVCKKDVDCVVSDYGEWGPCNNDGQEAKCGGGTQTRERVVTTHAFGTSGDTCPKPYTQTQECNTTDCIPECNEYTARGGCKKCDAGYANRGDKCIKNEDCIFEWNDWSSCTAQCGGGIRRRGLNIIGESGGDGNLCPEPNALESREACNTFDCEPNCEEYDEQGNCLRCEKAFIFSGDSKSYTLNNNTGKCDKDIDCEMNPWSDWSVCTKNCGGGMKSRSRTVKIPQGGSGNECGGLAEDMSCNTYSCIDDCDVYGGSSGQCVACGDEYKLYDGECHKKIDFCKGKYFKKENNESICGEAEDIITNVEGFRIIEDKTFESDCEEGYLGDFCETCAKGYVRYNGQCYKKIEKCKGKYTQKNGRDICDKDCEEKYKGDRCNICEEGHVLYNGICYQKIKNCHQKYKFKDGKSICDNDCLKGYQGENCDDCESGYISWAGQCFKEIKNCISKYKNDFFGNPVCDESCASGYKGDKCDECAETHIKQDGECYQKIKNCTGRYDMHGDNSVCVEKTTSPASETKILIKQNMCKHGYNGWQCEECKNGFTKEDGICYKNINNCEKYDRIDDDTTCLKCKKGYTGHSCSECENGYIKSDWWKCFQNDGKKVCYKTCTKDGENNKPSPPIIETFEQYTSDRTWVFRTPILAGLSVVIGVLFIRFMNFKLTTMPYLMFLGVMTVLIFAIIYQFSIKEKETPLSSKESVAPPSILNEMDNIIEKVKLPSAEELESSLLWRAISMYALSFVIFFVLIAIIYRIYFKKWGKITNVSLYTFGIFIFFFITTFSGYKTEKEKALQYLKENQK